MEPITGLAIGASVAGKVGGWLAGGGARRRQRRARRDLKSLGGELRAFDPMSYAKDASQAQWNMLQNPLAEAISDYRAGQVGQGRLKTGFRFQGEDRMVRDVYQNFMDQVASRSMQGAGMKLGALESAGDVYTGLYDMGAREEERTSNFWGGMGNDLAFLSLYGG
ncbi:MAG: hypothetical protein JSW25_07800 [Thermoplasmata archaeon]|nr:MAG: hypothetical protein JSW25_07800 [Thermoplasmata archaeon]